MSYIILKYKQALILIVLIILIIITFFSPTYALRKRQLPQDDACRNCIIQCCIDFCSSGTCAEGYSGCDSACGTGPCNAFTYDGDYDCSTLATDAPEPPTPP